MTIVEQGHLKPPPNNSHLDLRHPFSMSHGIVLFQESLFINVAVFRYQNRVFRTETAATNLKYFQMLFPEFKKIATTLKKCF
mgnify:CR=1 FL=1